MMMMMKRNLSFFSNLMIVILCYYCGAWGIVGCVTASAETSSSFLMINENHLLQIHITISVLLIEDNNTNNNNNNNNNANYDRNDNHVNGTDFIISVNEINNDNESSKNNKKETVLLFEMEKSLVQNFQWTKRYHNNNWWNDGITTIDIFIPDNDNDKSNKHHNLEDEEFYHRTYIVTLWEEGKENNNSNNRILLSKRFIQMKEQYMEIQLKSETTMKSSLSVVVDDERKNMMKQKEEITTTTSDNDNISIGSSDTNSTTWWFLRISIIQTFIYQVIKSLFALTVSFVFIGLIVNWIEGQKHNQTEEQQQRIIIQQQEHDQRQRSMDYYQHQDDDDDDEYYQDDDDEDYEDEEEYNDDDQQDDSYEPQQNYYNTIAAGGEEELVQPPPAINRAFGEESSSSDDEDFLPPAMERRVVTVANVNNDIDFFMAIEQLDQAYSMSKSSPTTTSRLSSHTQQQQPPLLHRQRQLQPPTPSMVAQKAAATAAAVSGTEFTSTAAFAVKETNPTTIKVSNNFNLEPSNNNKLQVDSSQSQNIVTVPLPCQNNDVTTAMARTVTATTNGNNNKNIVITNVTTRTTTAKSATDTKAMQQVDNTEKTNQTSTTQHTGNNTKMNHNNDEKLTAVFDIPRVDNNKPNAASLSSSVINDLTCKNNDSHINRKNTSLEVVVQNYADVHQQTQKKPFDMVNFSPSKTDGPAEEKSILAITADKVSHDITCNAAITEQRDFMNSSCSNKIKNVNEQLLPVDYQNSISSPLTQDADKIMNTSEEEVLAPTHDGEEDAKSICESTNKFTTMNNNNNEKLTAVLDIPAAVLDIPEVDNNKPSAASSSSLIINHIPGTNNYLHNNRKNSSLEMVIHDSANGHQQTQEKPIDMVNLISLKTNSPPVEENGIMAKTSNDISCHAAMTEQRNSTNSSCSNNIKNVTKQLLPVDYQNSSISPVSQGADKMITTNGEDVLAPTNKGEEDAKSTTAICESTNKSVMVVESTSIQSNQENSKTTTQEIQCLPNNRHRDIVNNKEATVGDTIDLLHTEQESVGENMNKKLNDSEINCSHDIDFTNSKSDSAMSNIAKNLNVEDEISRQKSETSTSKKNIQYSTNSASFQHLNSTGSDFQNKMHSTSVAAQKIIDRQANHNKVDDKKVVVADVNKTMVKDVDSFISRSEVENVLDLNPQKSDIKAIPNESEKTSLETLVKNASEKSVCNDVGLLTGENLGKTNDFKSTDFPINANLAKTILAEETRNVGPRTKSSSSREKDIIARDGIEKTPQSVEGAQERLHAALVTASVPPADVEDEVPCNEATKDNLKLNGVRPTRLKFGKEGKNNTNLQLSGQKRSFSSMEKDEKLVVTQGHELTEFQNEGTSSCTASFAPSLVTTGRDSSPKDLSQNVNSSPKFKIQRTVTDEEESKVDKYISVGEGLMSSSVSSVGRKDQAIEKSNNTQCKMRTAVRGAFGAEKKQSNNWLQKLAHMRKNDKRDPSDVATAKEQPATDTSLPPSHEKCTPDFSYVSTLPPDSIFSDEDESKLETYSERCRMNDMEANDDCIISKKRNLGNSNKPSSIRLNLRSRASKANNFRGDNVGDHNPPTPCKESKQQEALNEVKDDEKIHVEESTEEFSQVQNHSSSPVRPMHGLSQESSDDSVIVVGTRRVAEPLPEVILSTSLLSEVKSIEQPAWEYDGVGTESKPSRRRKRRKEVPKAIRIKTRSKSRHRNA